MIVEALPKIYHRLLVWTLEFSVEFTMITPLFILKRMYTRRGVDNVYFQNLLLNFRSR